LSLSEEKSLPRIGIFSGHSVTYFCGKYIIKNIITLFTLQKCVLNQWLLTYLHFNLTEFYEIFLIMEEQSILKQKQIISTLRKLQSHLSLSLPLKQSGFFLNLSILKNSSLIPKRTLENYIIDYFFRNEYSL